MVRGYTSSLVPTGEVGLVAEAFDRVRVGAALEHTLTMNTALADGAAPTSVSRWELEGSYAILRGGFELRARAGLGHRGFAMNTDATVRSPDGDYTYGILGASVSVRVNDRLRLEGGLAYEPVFGGSTPTMGMFGADGRVAFDIGIGAVVEPTARTFVRAAFDYQRFSWDLLTDANAPVGSASDGYPSGTLSLGARY
jgi:opacity protein-like surface antigen